jgi:hypothetical protein
MRAEVILAVAALADSQYQHHFWGVRLPSGAYDDLSMSIHTLYDDDIHLPNVDEAVGTVLVDGAELDRLRVLDSHLSPIIAELGNAPDSDYLAHKNWSSVVAAAQLALSSLVLGQLGI